MIAQVNQKLFSSSFRVSQAAMIEMSPPDTVTAAERSRHRQAATHSPPPPQESFHISNNLLRAIHSPAPFTLPRLTHRPSFTFGPLAVS
jgi:hypothetical protein